LKTIATSETGFKSHLRVTEEFGFVSDASLGDVDDSLDYSRLRRGHAIGHGSRDVLLFRWHRDDGTVEGFEMLSVELDAGIREWHLPVDGVRCFYSLGAPLQRDGSFARRLAGTVRIEAMTATEFVVSLDLEASMVRWSGSGPLPLEPISGTFHLPRLDRATLTAWQTGQAAKP